MFPNAFKSAVIVSAVAFLAVARGVPTRRGGECNNGGLQCCKTVMKSADVAKQHGGLLGGLLGSLGLDLGLQCTPINVLGIENGADCNQQTVWCKDVTQSGVINLGCTPINLNL